MRYGRDREHTFGIIIDRDIYRYSERESWPLIRQSKPGFVSQFGSLHGLDDLESPRKLSRAENARRRASWTTSSASSWLRVNHAARLYADRRWGEISASKRDNFSCDVKQSRSPERRPEHTSSSAAVWSSSRSSSAATPELRSGRATWTSA